MIKVGLIIHGLSKQKKLLYKQLDQLPESIFIQETLRPNHAIDIAFEMSSNGFTHIISVGGDGTLNEVVNGIMNSKNENVILGLLPFGTANDFYKTLNGGSKMEDLITLINKGVHQEIDIGGIRYQESDGTPMEKYFVNIADLGIGADVVQRINGTARWLGADITFAKSILTSLISYKNQFVQVNAGTWQWSGKMKSLVLANGKYFGSGLCIAPEALPSDGQLSCVILGDITVFDYLKNVQKVKKGGTIEHSQVHYHTCSKMKIQVENNCGIEADGEFIGKGSCDIFILPKALRFLAGPFEA